MRLSLTDLLLVAIQFGAVATKQSGNEKTGITRTDFYRWWATQLAGSALHGEEATERAAMLFAAMDTDPRDQVLTKAEFRVTDEDFVLEAATSATWFTDPEGVRPQQRRICLAFVPTLLRCCPWRQHMHDVAPAGA
eukprot:SAG11_NODE_225_length_12064_cov_7.850815_9_plen_136_part_00